MSTGTPSRAKAFFEKVKAEGRVAEFWDQLVKSPMAADESEFMDFKHGVGWEGKQSELRSLWAKCLSCFANSDGGVLIFGVNAPNGKPESLSAVPDVKWLVKYLKGVVPNATEPPVQGVDIQPLPIPSEGNTGFVVCYIPASPWRPHQVKADGEYRNLFFMRTTDNCVSCTVATLRALFAPQHVSRFVVRYCLITKHISPQFKEVTFACWVKNHGPATAKELFTFVEYPSSDAKPRRNVDWRETRSDRPGLAMVLQQSFHPGEQINLCQFDISPTFENPLIFTIRLTALDQRPQGFLIEIKTAGLADNSMQLATPIEVE